jgi:biopolymer transport protein ExbB/TolQ
VNHSKSLQAKVFGSPFLWGTVFTVGFYKVFLQYGEGTIAYRYLAGHPVEYVTFGLFIIGLTALAFRTFSLMRQEAQLDEISLGEIPQGGQAVEDSKHLLDKLFALPEKYHGNYLTKRLQNSLVSVRRNESADDLDNELKYLAEEDEYNQSNQYALVHLIAWAIPILGMLGTIMGVTGALGNLDSSAFGESEAMKASLGAVVTSLGVAFDTTGVALSLLILLMFAAYRTKQSETQLLHLVKEKSRNELMGRFMNVGGSNDPIVKAVHRMSEEMLKSVDGLVGRQSDLWESTVNKAESHWTQQAKTLSDQIQESLKVGLESTLIAHANRLIEEEAKIAIEARKHWQEVTETTAKSAKAMNEIQIEMQDQTEVLLKVVQATGDITKLEDALNKNLTSLQNSQNFEETTLNLSAVLNLLTAKLSSTEDRKVSLNSSKTKDDSESKAA